MSTIINWLKLIPMILLCCCGQRKEENPVNPDSIVNNWAQTNVVVEIGYTILDQTNTQKIDLKEALDTNTACSKTRYYSFKPTNIVLQNNSDSSCADTLTGFWEIRNDSLILTQIDFFIPSNQFLPLLDFNLPENNLTTSLKIISLKKSEMVLESSFKTTLTKAQWDENPEIYNAVFPGLYPILPFGYQTKQIFYFNVK